MLHVKKSCRRRAAFTVIEMILVLAIIATLMTLSVAAVSRYRDLQKSKNTQLLLQKVADALHKHRQVVLNEANKRSANSVPAWCMTMAGNDSIRARVIFRKAYLKNAFPMSFTEALNSANSPPVGIDPVPAYGRVSGIVDPKAPVRNGENRPEFEMSVCLYLILQESHEGAIFDPDTGLSAKELLPTNDPEVKYIVDAWDNPIAFFRWPIGLPIGDPTDIKASLLNPAFQLEASNPANIATDPNAPGSRFRDPEDPEGKLIEPKWWADPNPNQRKAFEDAFHPVSAWFFPLPSAAKSVPQSKGEPYAYYSVAVVASAGKYPELRKYPYGILFQGLATSPNSPFYMNWSGELCFPPNEFADKYLYSYRYRLGSKAKN